MPLSVNIAQTVIIPKLLKIPAKLFLFILYTLKYIIHALKIYLLWGRRDRGRWMGRRGDCETRRETSGCYLP